MKIWTLWRDGEDGDMPWMVESYDEYTAEEHNGEPEWYRAERQPGDRELIITISDSHVRDLFETHEVVGKVSK